MADFDVKVVRVTNVYSHPDADRLSIVETTAGDFICISAKLDDGSHRYAIDDLVVYIPEQAVMPEWMMRGMDFWDVNKNKPAFRYVKAKKLRGIFSQGILYPTGTIDNRSFILKEGPGSLEINEGDDVGEFLGIHKYEPVVPASMSGQMSGAYLEYTMKYDFDNIQKEWDIFNDDDYVIATEKLHGTLIQIIYVPTLEDADAFGDSKKLLVTSKGMGAKGFVYKNVPENKDNLYVRTLNKLLVNGLEENILHVLPKLDPDQTLHLFGEVFGEGIQDLGYGSKTPQVKFFDVAVGQKYVSSFSCNQMLEFLELEHVPVLYSGPFDKEKLLTFRDGLDTISNSHIREGIVIRTWTEQEHPKHGRKIAKWVSPDYLLRKNGTEFN